MTTTTDDDPHDDRPVPRVFVCGARAVIQRGPSDFRVVCATCDGGGSRRYANKHEAMWAAIRDSDRRCQICGTK